MISPTRPPGLMTLNRGHPLISKLQFAFSPSWGGGGLLQELVGGNLSSANNGRETAVGYNGTGIENMQAGHAAFPKLLIPTTGTSRAKTISIICTSSVPAANLTTGTSGIFYSRVSSGPAYELVIRKDSTTGKFCYASSFFNGAAQDWQDFQSTVGPVAARAYHVILVRTGVTNADTLTFYIDGVQDSQTTVDSTKVPGSSPNNGGIWSAGASAQVGIYDIRGWERALSPQEVSLLFSDPYGMYRHHPHRFPRGGISGRWVGR
jgi:hypothetical protein